MKTKIEAVANVIVILVALAAGFAVLRAKLAEPRLPPSVAVGDHLAPIPGIDWSRHRRTLVLALRSDCHYCRDSAPFYQRLAQSKRTGGDDVEIVAAFPNDAAAVHQAMEEDALPIRSVSGVPMDKWRVVGTPTLILVDTQGQVVRTWTGVLTPRSELEVEEALGASPQAAGADHAFADCQEGESSTVSRGSLRGCESSAENQK